MIQAVRDSEAPCEKNRKGHLVELGRGPVRRSVEKPVLIPTAVWALAGLKVAERAQGRGAVARIEQRGCDATQIAWPDEVIDVVAVVIGLTPRRAGSRNEGAGVRFVF